MTERGARGAVLGAALGMFAATLAWRLLTFTGFSNDHYAHVGLAQQMLLGERPIRDFTDPGWPLTYLLSAAAWRLAGDAMLTEWALVATAFAIGAACTVLAAHRLSGSIAIAVLVTAAEILIYPRTYAYPKILPYAVAAWVIVSASGVTRRTLALLAGTTAVAFLLRHDHGLYVGAAAAVWVALASRREGLRCVARRVIVLATATAALLTPWLVYVAANGGIVAYFETALEFARAEADATTLDAWPTFSLTPPLYSAGNAEAWLFWLFWSLPVVSVALVVLRARRGHEQLPVERTIAAAEAARTRRLKPPLYRGITHPPVERTLQRARPDELTAVTALAALALCVDAGFLRDLLRTRLPDAVVPAALLGAWLLGVSRRARLDAAPEAGREGPPCVATESGRRTRRGGRAVARIAATAVVVASFAAIGTVAEVREQLDRAQLTDSPGRVLDRVRWVSGLLALPHRQTLAPPSRVSAALMPFYEYVDRCTSRADRLIVTGGFADIPVLAGRGFASDGVVFGEWYSSVRNRGRTLERLRARPALLTIVIDRDQFRERFPRIDDYIAEAYDPMADVPVEGMESVRVLAYRGRKATRTDAPTGWPCFR